MKGVFEKNDLRMRSKRFCGFLGFPPMFHSHMELFYVQSGTLCMNVDSTEYTLHSGQVGFVFPYVVHSYEEAPETEVIMLMFAPDAVADFEKTLRSCKPVSAVLENGASLQAAFEKILSYANGEAAEQRVALAYLNALVGEVLLQCTLTEVGGASQDVIFKVLSYCGEHFCDEDISIRTVAQALFVSESYITKIFSVRLGYSFRDYINGLRLHEAERLLRKTDLKITEIMSNCGFKNQSSFNRIFLQNFDCTPREYRGGT